VIRAPASVHLGVQSERSAAEHKQVSDVSCRACGAALAPNATWCSLCYADLRHPIETPVASAPAVTHAAVSAAAKAEIPIAPTAAAAMRATVTAASADVLDAATPLPTDDHPLHVAAPAPTWPCPRCGARVSMELDSCDSCGAGFLAETSSTSVSMKLPVVGDLNRLSKGQRLVVAIGFAVVMMVLFVLLAEIGGHIL
jgi:ribosomal protein L40E